MNDLFSIEGKIVLVTGGSRGIGEMIAAGFLAKGAKVYISSRKTDVCDATAKRLNNPRHPLPQDYFFRRRVVSLIRTHQDDLCYLPTQGEN